MFLVRFLLSLCTVSAFRSLPLLSTSRISRRLSENDEYITVEITTTNTKVLPQAASEKTESTIIGYQNLYEEVKENKMQRALVENPILKKILSVFGKGALTAPKEGVEPVKELPYQIFECEKCQMEMRPARGRAEAIFGRPRFRCSRCGAKASSYFDVDDLDDPRAVSRLERLEKEKNREVYGEDDDDTEDADGDNDEE